MSFTFRTRFSLVSKIGFNLNLQDILWKVLILLCDLCLVRYLCMIWKLTFSCSLLSPIRI
ncbi:unnamed protein product, partial [Vitis vinifera]|uniref:Uncharacterized protein n=1 Tax=Vitis vinifera TaxID=29760 RepID=D7SHT3_VITVI